MAKTRSDVFAGNPVPIEQLNRTMSTAIKTEFGITDALYRRYEPVFLRTLTQREDHKTEQEKPDYTKPGKVGTSAAPNLIWVWSGPAEGWKKLPLKKPSDPCETVIIEALYSEDANPCPPAGGFASVVAEARKKAIETAKDLECPDDCPGSTVIITVYREWHCAAGAACADVQVARYCNMI